MAEQWRGMHTHLSALALGERCSEPKVSEREVAIGTDQQVLRFEVPVRQSLLKLAEEMVV